MSESAPITALDLPAGEYAIVEVLGHRVELPCSYFYCRRCHVGVNPVRRWLGLESGGVSLGSEDSEF